MTGGQGRLVSLQFLSALRPSSTTRPVHCPANLELRTIFQSLQKTGLSPVFREYVSSSHVTPRRNTFVLGLLKLLSRSLSQQYYTVLVFPPVASLFPAVVCCSRPIPKIACHLARNFFVRLFLPFGSYDVKYDESSILLIVEMLINKLISCLLQIYKNCIF